ncbi:class I SAM-dependent methyltransferase [Mycobacterium sp. CVI_P3]|uniref:Class I SAM-dependent methyltransferase n=1 Tax=Mycobacterium pinniadriaticum TaxID=2994102 RepID=A0ABT3SJ70_9MYCO|nr:class I SAM-dependent methyltransferase [Mycobacterium pinniadriaticum]MCX2933149.1 class I SAM-dependent methyltransferase [Mycobacterium pinniadriaticum]MCX2939551.1 class I SAM-dependent methyltransferase [Mycobacterium pinniadriaticum]
MAYMAEQITDIADMPRGGPDASWLDRLLETDCPEYLDRDDVDDDVKRGIVAALDRIGTLFGEHDRNAELVLREVADIADPAILELGAGHGALSRKVLEQHPTAHLTVSDLDPESVAAMAASDLGDNSRATVAVIDATAIDAADGSFDLAVFALSFHHLSPAQAARVMAEGTRVADKLLVIDLPRPPSTVHLLRLAVIAPFALWWPFAHDGLISSLRSYSPSALRALADHAGVDVAIGAGLLDPQVVVARRRS